MQKEPHFAQDRHVSLMRQIVPRLLTTPFCSSPPNVVPYTETESSAKPCFSVLQNPQLAAFYRKCPHLRKAWTCLSPTLSWHPSNTVRTSPLNEEGITVIPEAEEVSAHDALVGPWTATPPERRRILLSRCATVYTFPHFLFCWVRVVFWACLIFHSLLLHCLRN